MTELRNALIEGGNYTEAQANEAIADMKDRVLDEEDPEEVLRDYGLEPDYILDIIDF